MATQTDNAYDAWNKRAIADGTMYQHFRKRVFAVIAEGVTYSPRRALFVLADDVLQVVFEYPHLDIHDALSQLVTFDRIGAVLGAPMACPVEYAHPITDLS